ncbi:unnamed protein product [Brassica oleracea var. botrytis]
MLELIEIGNKLVGRKRQVVEEKFGWIFYYCVFLNTVRCPFCKTPNYAVEYRGVKTKEEKGIEQVEEQRVIEAKIRMMENEKQDYEDKLQKRMESCSSSISAMTGEFEQCSASGRFCVKSSNQKHMFIILIGFILCALVFAAEPIN